MARRKRGQIVDGWLLIDKPEGVTSTQVVGRARWALDAQKAGHSGTLDPLASGLLAVALGEATKTVPFAQDGLKTYQFTVRWGELSSTDDREGEVLRLSDVRPTEADILKVLPRFIGDIQQRPPIFSAIKVAGERAYDLARKGIMPDLPTRPIHMADLRLTGMPDADHAQFEMTCGKGGYVRSIARDMGEALGTVARIETLRRVSSGQFHVKNALTIQALEALRENADAKSSLLPVEAGLAALPEIRVDRDAADRLSHGGIPPGLSSPSSPFWVSCGGRPIAILEEKPAGPVILRNFMIPDEEACDNAPAGDRQ
jgi:tRNA pseudouridine55 synthase